MFVTLEEAKGYLRVDSSDEDSFILGLMETANALIKNVTRRTPAVLKKHEAVVRTAELYVIAYLYEHREEADHKAMTETVKYLLMIELMRDRITIQKSSVKTDKIGNHAAVWEDVYSCAAYANNLSGKEYWAAKQLNAQSELDFIIRYCSEVAALDSEHYRIRFRGDLYNITFIDNVQYKNKSVRIRTERVKR